jgi:hypothetical protein
MTNRSKAIGTNAENQVVAYLNANGYPYVERRTLAGSRDRGDIAGIPGVVIEVKAAKRLELGAWLRELDTEIAQDHADTGCLWVKQHGKSSAADWFIVTRPSIQLALWNKAGW